LRIIHTVPAISEEASGPSYSVPRLCESLIDHGIDVRLAVLDWAPMSSPPIFLKVFPLGLAPRRLGRSPAMKRWLFEETRSHKVELIHNHSLWMMPNVYPGWVARTYNIPYIVSPRDTLSAWSMLSGSKMKPLFWSLVQRPALAETTCFHATAQSEREDIRFIGFKQPIAVVPNGIDIPILPPKSFFDLRTLLFISRIHPQKGLDILLPAWREVQDRFPEWQLRIVGPDNVGYLAKMQGFASKLKLKRIEFCGALYGKEKIQAYRDAELFVLPTYSENFGMVVAEALAAGTPAIVSKGAPWEGLQIHNAGRWIEIGLDPLVAALEKMLSCSSDDLLKMGQRGRLWMEKDFSWRNIGHQMAMTYRWVLEGGAKPDWVYLD